MSFSPLSALKCAAVLSAALIAGCGSDDGSSAFKAGQEAYRQHDLRKAGTFFEQAVAAAATNADAYVCLSRVRFELGELKAARQAIAKAAELAGDDSDIRLLDAQISWHAKDYAAASAGFARIANDSKLDPSLRAQGWSGLGVVEMTCENRDLARIAFMRAIRADRRNAAARYHLGLLYRDGFDYPEAALEQLEIYVRLDDVASKRVQKVQRSVIPEIKDVIARKAASRPGASRSDSGASSAAIQKAEAAWKKGTYKTARKFYQDALAADPLSYPAALGLAKAHLQSDASREGQKQALAAYQVACSLRPGAVSTFLTAGKLALNLGQPARAASLYSRAVAANPTSLEALDGLITALRKTGNRAKDAKAYQDYRNSLVTKN